MRKFILILFTFYISLSALSQKADYGFEHISKEDGLKQNYITCITQDSYGFIWLGTQNGLTKYDGHTFTIYKTNSSERNSISTNDIQELFIDKNNNLWIGTYGGGLCKYNYDTDDFTCYRSNQENASTLSNDNVYAIAQDTSGIIWLGTNGGGLNSFDPITETFFHYIHNPLNPQSISSSDVKSLLIDKKGNIWAGTDGGGLNLLRQNEKNFTAFKKSNLPNSIASNTIMSIAEDAHGIIWLGSYDAGLIRLDPQTYIFSVFSETNGYLPDNTIWSISQTTKDELWIATRGGGICVFNTQTFETKSYQHRPHDRNSISSNNINYLYKDNNGVIWVGTAGEGIDKLNYDNKKFDFTNIFLPKSKTGSTASITGIAKSEKNDIWISTRAEGIIQLDSNLNITKQIKKENGLASNNLQTIMVDSKGRVWSGTVDYGVCCYYPESKKIITYNSKNPQWTEIKNDFINVIYESKDGKIWVGTWGGGLYAIDLEKNSVKGYPIDNNHGLNIVICLNEDRRGDIWVGTYGKGLAKLNKNTGRFKFYSHEKNNPHSISNNTVNCIEEDQDPNYIWLGTNGGGLNKFDRENESFIYYSEKEGLANDIVHGIIPYKNYLWLTTASGITRFNKKTKTSENFDKNDGLHGNTFMKNSHVHTTNSKILLGGRNGITWFNPDSVFNSRFESKVNITRFYLGSRPVGIGEKIHDKVILSSSLATTNQIVLSSQHKVFSFAFSSNDYANPNKITYAYKMENFDESWNITDANRRFATYSILSEGTYIFKVKSTNSDGIWSNNITSMKIIIEPPFWKTKWFYTLVIIAIIAMLYTFFRIKTKRLKTTNKKLEEKVQQRTKEIEKRNFELQEKQFQVLSQQNEIVEQKKTLEIQNKELYQLSIIASKTENAISILDSMGNIEWINHSFARLYDIRSDINFEIEVINIIDIKKNNTIDIILEKCRRTLSNVSFESENTVLERKFWTQTSITPILNEKNEVERLIAIDTDITKLKEAESKIRRQRDQISLQHKELEEHRVNLEKLVNARTKELEIALKKAKEADRLKTSFLTNMSHEIRTPMNSIIGFSTLLKHPRLKREKLEKYVHLINKNGEHLVRLIDDIIDLSKAETGQLIFNKKIFKLSTIFSDYLKKYKAKIKAENKEITLIQHIPAEIENLEIYSDPYRLEQVLNNLIDNAVKYTEFGKIEFGMQLSANKTMVECYVKDTGIGLKKEEIEKIFGKFNKIENEKTKLYRGTGLGLALSLQIMHKLNGEMQVESEYNKGSTFTFSLKLEGSHKNILKTNDWSDYTILVAEDEENNYLFIEETLNEFSPNIIHAWNGLEAVEYCNTSAPDIIIMDIKMPKMDGIEATQIIKKHHASIPILGFSAFTHYSDQEKFHKFGFDDYIHKPIDRDTLIGMIRKRINTIGK